MAVVRVRPRVVVKKASPNQSTRTAPISLIVLHDTESHNYPGSSDLKGLANWFANPNAQVSSHVATDGDGFSARFVHDDMKAWHCAGFNSASLGIEQIGFATDTRDQWFSRRKQLRETARWIARWSLLHGIPIQKGSVNGANGTIYKPGVVTHAMLGSRGGGHHDPGPGYPFNTVLWLARYYKRRLK